MVQGESSCLALPLPPAALLHETRGSDCAPAGGDQEGKGMRVLSTLCGPYVANARNYYHCQCCYWGGVIAAGQCFFGLLLLMFSLSLSLFFSGPCGGSILSSGPALPHH